MGAVGLASLVAHVAFWLLVVCGWLTEDLGTRGVAAFVVAWLAGLFLLPYMPYGAALFSPAVAVLDIALVLTIFKGDVRLH